MGGGGVQSMQQKMKKGDSCGIGLGRGGERVSHLKPEEKSFISSL